MRRTTIAAVSLLALAPGLATGSAGAQTASPPRVSITIYNENLALIEERRTLDLPAGRSRQEFRDVSAQIRPETVSIQAPGAAVVEQNFDYDLLTPDKLMEEAVGQQVTIVRTNPGSGAETRETATVLAANAGVVLRIGDRIEVLRDDGVPTRVIFDRVPPNMRARPTLSVTLNASRAGSREAVLSYLTTGMSWKADYVALFDEKAGTIDLQGWITLNNQTGTSFVNADTQLVAGDVTLNGGGDPYGRGGYYPPPPPPPRGRPGIEPGQGLTVGDYYLYPLPQPTTIEQNQTKQVGFLSAQGVAGRRVYEFDAQGLQSTRAQSASVTLAFSNAREAGLGSQLPAGTLRVYMRDVRGEPRFTGENAIGHTPAGSELSIKTGEAFDVTVQPTVVSQTRLDSGPRSQGLRTVMRYEFRNARREPVTVAFRQHTGATETRIVEESLASRAEDNDTRAWDVRVPANGTTALTFTVETR
ncbi:MAG TPA: DUF4139 domain-containing protein [Caulobacteraceae bacterium]|jgi:hypothetical protein